MGGDRGDFSHVGEVVGGRYIEAQARKMAMAYQEVYEDEIVAHGGAVEVEGIGEARNFVRFLCHLGAHHVETYWDTLLGQLWGRSDSLRLPKRLFGEWRRRLR